jgi:hypothetical protein
MSQTPIIHDVFKEGSYILSEAFYTGGEGQSQLELLVTKYLKEKPIQPEELTPLYKDSKHWSDNNRKYLLPVLTVLALYSNDSSVSDWLKKEM